MTNKELYQSTFSQLHTSVQVNWEDYQPMKKRTKITRIFIAVAAAAAILGAFTVTAVAFNLFGLRDLAFPERTTLHVPVVDPDTGDVSYEDRVVDMISLQGYADTPESQACMEWESFYEDYIAHHPPFGNDIYNEGGGYSEYSVYDDTMAAKLDEIAAKYGLELHQTMSDVPGRDAWLEVIGPTFLGKGNIGYFGYRYDDGTCAFDGEAAPEGYGILEYQFRYSRKGYLDTVSLNVGNLSDYVEWDYTAACGVPVKLALGPTRAFIWADLPEGFAFVNILSGSLGDEYFSTDPISEWEVEALADLFDFTALNTQK